MPISRPRPFTLLLAAVVMAALSVAAWYAWLGWDHEYQIDPGTGVASGPYETWQVVGCALTLIVVALAGGVWARPGLPIAVMPLAFTVAWSVDAARTDETGLWGVGAFLLLVGSLFGATVLAGVAAAVRGRLLDTPSEG